MGSLLCDLLSLTFLTVRDASISQIFPPSGQIACICRALALGPATCILREISQQPHQVLFLSSHRGGSWPERPRASRGVGWHVSGIWFQGCSGGAVLPCLLGWWRETTGSTAGSVLSCRAEGRLGPSWAPTGGWGESQKAPGSWL